MQIVNGSPVYDGLQEHMGLWFITLQLAFTPHGFGHGFSHLLLTQALSCGHSVLTTHSGRQLGGAPIYSAKQEHTAWLLIDLHWLFGPQGDGKQTSIVVGGGWGSAKTAIIYLLCIFELLSTFFCSNKHLNVMKRSSFYCITYPDKRSIWRDHRCNCLSMYTMVNGSPPGIPH